MQRCNETGSCSRRHGSCVVNVAFFWDIWESKHFPEAALHIQRTNFLLDAGRQGNYNLYIKKQCKRNTSSQVTDVMLSEAAPSLQP